MNRSSAIFLSFFAIILCIQLVIANPLSAEPGKLLWRSPLKAPDGSTYGFTWSAPVVIKDRCYMQDQEGGIYCFRTTDGEQLWYNKIFAGGPQSSPVYRNGKLFMVAGIGDDPDSWPPSDTLYRLDPECGGIEKQVTPVPGGGIGSMAPAVSDSMVYICAYSSAAGTSILFAIDVDTFDVVWEKPVGNASVIIGEKVLFVLADKLYGLDLQTGEEYWSMDSPNTAGFEMGALSGDILVAFTKTTGYPDYLPSELHAFRLSPDNLDPPQPDPNAPDGLDPPTLLWSFAYESGQYADGSPPTIDSSISMVYAVNRSGVLKAFDPEGDGLPLWMKTVRGSGSASAKPVAFDGKLYIQTEETNGDLFLSCFNGSDGTEIWKSESLVTVWQNADTEQQDAWTADGFTSGEMDIAWGSPAVVDGKIYIATDHGGGLFAFESDPSENNWYMVNQNPNLTGSVGEWKKDFTNSPSTLGLNIDNQNTAFGFSDQPPMKIGLPDYQVNTATLNLVLQGTVFWMKTRGPSVAAALVYNADHTLPPGLFGPGWRFAYESTAGVGCTGKNVEVRKGSGQVLTFSSEEDLTSTSLTYPLELTPAPGNFDRFTVDENHCEWFEKSSRFTYRYEKTTLQGSGIFYLTSVTDRNGNSVVLERDLGTGKINSITGPALRQLTLTYDENDHCIQIATPAFDNRTIDFEYDEQARLIAITDMAGYRGTYEYDEDGYMNKMTNEGHWATFEYASRGPGLGKYVTKVQDSDTAWTLYELLEHDPIKVKRTSRLGKPRIFKSKNGQTRSVTDPLGNIRNIEYQNNLPVSFEDRNGRIKKLEYDDRGNITKQIDALNRWTRFAYNPDDTLHYMTNANSEIWYYEWDQNQNLTKITSPSPENNVTRISYDPYGQIDKITDPNGNVTDYYYDLYGNLKTVTDPLGNITRLGYDGSDLHCTSITDARENEKQIIYDDNDRLNRYYYGPDYTGPSVRNEFDAFGQTRLTDENGNQTRVERNRFGYITKLVPPLGNDTDYDYDPDNNLIEMTDPLGRDTDYVYNDNGWLYRTTDALSHSVYRYYDKEGNLIRLKDQRANETLFDYDSNDRLTENTDPLNRTFVYTRDNLGRISEKTNKRGQKVGYAFDGEGRMTSKTYDGVPEATYEYDPAGNLIQMFDDWGTTTYAYDARNQVKTITYPDTQTVTFTYDELGNYSSITYPDGQTVTYAYDDFNRVTIPRGLRNGANIEIRQNSEKPNRITAMNWGETRFINCEYDPAARLTRQTRSNGTVTDYSYDINDRLTGIAHKNNEAPFLEMNYTFDGADNLTSETSTNPVSPYVDDASLGATIDAANQISQLGADTYTFDSDGNRTAVSNNRFSAVYGPENHATQVTCDGISASYTYDGQGRMVQRIVNGQTSNYHYDLSGRLLFQTDDSGTVNITYLYIGKKLVAMGTASSGYTFFHFDRIGNALALTNDSGTVIKRYAYQPYGASTEDGPEMANPFTFVGAHGVMDLGQEVFLMKNRLYDAGTGKFLQTDPIGIDGGINLYTYAGNNPINNIDPEGTFIFTLSAATVFKVASVAFATYGTYKLIGPDGYVAKAMDQGIKTSQNWQKNLHGYQKDQENLNKAVDERREDVPETLNRAIDVAEHAPAGTSQAYAPAVNSMAKFLKRNNPIKLFEEGIEYLSGD